ncbi:hypothetical protein FB567DRAFT_457859 [Paraphoma chrysanthemicola]|uniref:Uncharacterized protein n=1 Tax=Paraphoma chrysanthemicola TaxID=798071 RepID=A0A8K0QT35_9PLEO|nr:hypothetical protein FB567DRAFT_457859 [Paraphoma chrysanthemicola]
MNRAPLHGAPVPGQQPRGSPIRGAIPSFATQDARSNLAVQPAANAGSFKLKKAAVKIVGAASPVPGPVKAKPKEAEGYFPETVKLAPKPSATAVAPKSAPAPPKIELPATMAGSESVLDEMFARLNARSPSVSSGAAKALSPGGPEKAHYSFDERSKTSTALSDVLKSFSTRSPESPDKAKPLAAAAVPSKPENQDHIPSIAATKGTAEVESMSEPERELEHMYLGKAAEYVVALPVSESASVKSIKTTSVKLRSSHAPDAKASIGDVEKLSARFAFAVTNYVNKTEKSTNPITIDRAKEALQHAEGNVLRLYIKLVEDSYLSMNNLDSIVGLCNSIMDILPKPEPKSTPAPSAVHPSTRKAEEPMRASTNPVESFTSWPAQEKREVPPAYRVCLLKGVSGIKSINQLQALVWGGRLESISMPSSGSDFAVVRFLTPEACEKYFQATENGIEIQGDKKTIVFVEKQPSPTSINDVMRNCIESDASRCVLALDADEDWSDMLLMKLAKGKSTAKREVDRIKRGKTARGRYYIEFRFANIYNALEFHRQLKGDHDWEDCTISYAADPCETAHGVHYKDEDDEGTAPGFFA